jgi:hypothetical protein
MDVPIECARLAKDMKGAVYHFRGREHLVFADRCNLDCEIIGQEPHIGRELNGCFCGALFNAAFAPVIHTDFGAL